MDKKIQLMIQCGGSVFFPECAERIVWETARKSAPGCLRFSLANGDRIPLGEGDRVMFSVGGVGVFCGYVFSITRSVGGAVSAVCYDQLRYLKNRDSYSYEMKTASEVVRMIAADHGLAVGVIEDTGYRIPSRVECLCSMFDIIGNALDITASNTNRLFVLFDDCGKLCLRSSENLRADILIDKRCAEELVLTSSIDSGVYNKIKVSASCEDSRDFLVAEDRAKIERWGVLQYCSSSPKSADADSLLKLYSRPNCLLEIKNAAGDVRVRGGAAVAVDADFGSLSLRRFVRVERARHDFYRGAHLMSLDCSVAEE